METCYGDLARRCVPIVLLEDGVNIRIIQRLLGHRSLVTTALYTHVAGNYINKTKSPLDTLKANKKIYMRNRNE
jgi:integrase